MTKRYFAYGSNLCATQMANRCPAAREGELVALHGWRFIINRRGVATLVPDASERVWGLVWSLTSACERALDRYEGVAQGFYRKVELEVGSEPALVYLAAVDQPGLPRKGYLQGIQSACSLRSVDADYQIDLARWARVVSPAVMQAALRGYRLAVDGLHGPGHWLRVLTNGWALADGTPGADRDVVELFALLHDCRRVDDGQDRGHGDRASTYVRSLAADGLLALDPGRLDLLAEACSRHELGDVSSDPTIGCCWDGDRLELSRLGRRPKAPFLSTAVAQEPALQEAAWLRGQTRVVDAALACRWGF
jgi:uncharacterized protein